MTFQKLHITDDPNVTLTCYIHDESDALSNARLRPAVLIFPGGGYQICTDREAEPVALAYMSEGFQAFVLRYTVGPCAGFPKPLEDAESALAVIRQHSNEWQVNIDQIAAVGFSAGGHLAAALGTMGKIKPAALVLCYPCILSTTTKRWPSFAPGLEDKADNATPPTFLFATCSDERVPSRNSLTFAAALEKAGIPFELHIFQNGVHGLSLSKPLTSSGAEALVDPIAAQWLPMSIDWLKLRFGEFSHSGGWDGIRVIPKKE